MKRPRNNYLKWARLDNTAQLFPVIAREGTSNVYRVSVVLNEEIDGAILQEALESVLPYFDTFRCAMKKGFFWYYFEENAFPVPQIKEEDTYPCLYMNPNSNNRYLFRVSYFGRRINLEVFHALTDGNGGFMFLKELTYSYLRKVHPEDPEIAHDMPNRETSFDSTDGYLQNYAGRKKTPYKMEKAVIIKGDHLAGDMLSIITGILPVGELKTVAKSYGATINQYLVAVYAWAIYTTFLRSQPSDRPINICVPVNLRPIFGSETGKNFFAMIGAVFKPQHMGMSFEEVLGEVKESLNAQLTKENLEKVFSYNVSNQINPALRAVPLYIKRAVLRRIYTATTRGTTTTLTNLGSIGAAAEYEKYIERFQAILAMSTCQDIKLTAVSYRDTTTLTFSSDLKDTQIQKAFFRKLAEDKIPVTIETNGVCYE